MENILQTIHKAALRFLVPLNPEEAYKIILNEAMKMVKADSGVIHLQTKEGFKVVRASSPKFYSIVPRKSGNIYNAFTTQRPIIADTKTLEKAHLEMRNLGLKSSIFIPLSYQRKSIGVLVLNSSTEKHFTAKELEILKLFGSLASLAIRKTQLYDETKKALEARDLFISMASHELKTPITTINGYAQLLQTKLAGKNNSESRWAEELSWETIRLAYLVNELLEVDRIKAGKLQYIWRECSLRQIVNRAMSDFHFTHPHHKVMLQDNKSDSYIVTGDFDKLLQVVINLLDNAAKFSPSGAEIMLRLNDKHNHILLSVSDKGKGISRGDLPGVFDKFSRGNNHSREGMGLGLFLAKNIIAQHHGRIKVISKENKGTIVEIKLPRAKT